MKNISTYLALGLFVALIGCGEKDTTAKKVDLDNNSSGNPLSLIHISEPTRQP
jgi:hypothetical protein